MSHQPQRQSYCPQSLSSMLDKGRACDRCCSLKTRCDAAVPCSRCRRLSLDCSYKRPLRRRGRPRRTGDEAAFSRFPTARPMRSPGDIRATGEPTVPVQVNSSPESFIRESSRQHDNTLAGGYGDDDDDDDDDDDADPADTNDDVDDNDGGDDSFANTAPTGDAPRNLIAQVVVLNQSDTSPDYLGDMSDNAFTESSQIGDTFPSIDSAAAHRILDQYFSKPGELGVFSIISALPVPVTSAYATTSGNSAHLPPEFLSMLLSIGMQLELTCTDHATRESHELLVDTLRIESIRRIPTLSWKSADINIYQCVALLLGSHTWCLKNDLAGIAERWHAIAGLIWTDLRRSARRHMLSDALIERTSSALHLQQVTLDLLHYRPAQAIDNGLAPFIPERLAPHVPASCDDLGMGINDRPDFFALFSPLVSCLDKVLKTPRMPDAIAGLHHELETYYLRFPPSMLEYKALKQPFEAEAMIWFHGIFMLTYISRDLIDLLTEDKCASQPEFYSGFEHAMLLGEALPVLSTLDPTGQALSAATVFFILMSSVVTAVALRQFHHCPLEHQSPSNVAGPAAPQSLEESAEWHVYFLESFIRTGSRFDSELVRSVNACLSSIMRSSGIATEDDQLLLHQGLTGLAHFRWCEGGYGIIKLPDDDALQLQWGRGLSGSSLSLAEPPSETDAAERREAIIVLASPASRACSSDYFDLSIRIF